MALSLNGEGFPKRHVYLQKKVHVWREGVVSEEFNTMVHC